MHVCFNEMQLDIDLDVTSRRRAGVVGCCTSRYMAYPIVVLVHSRGGFVSFGKFHFVGFKLAVTERFEYSCFVLMQTKGGGGIAQSGKHCAQTDPGVGSAPVQRVPGGVM